MKERIFFLGSTDCQPVAFGRWPNAMQRKHGCRRKLFAASCRELQASGLCSPEEELSASSLTHFLRRFSHIGSVRSVASFVLHIFEVGSEVERFG